MKHQELSKLPLFIIDLTAISSKALANELEKTPENATFKREGDFLSVYA